MEPLYRGRCIDGKEWKVGTYYFDAYRSNHQIVVFVLKNVSPQKPFGDRYNEFHNVDFDTVGMLIARSKKYPEGIFIGDIVRYHKRIGEIVFNKKEGAFCLYTPFDNHYVQLNDFVVNNIVMLGNRYDNPELLKR